MIRLKISLLLTLLFSISLNAQIANTIFENGDAFNSFPQLRYVNIANIPVVNMPEVNVNALLQEDRELDVQGIGRPFRFGHNIETNISMEQGQWHQTEQHNIWSVRIASQNAYSLNFVLSDVRLSPRAELYLFNPDGFMVSGAITARDIHPSMRGVFPSTVLVGSSIIIQIIEPITDNQFSNIRITRVTHGYKNTFPFIKPK